VRGGTPRAASGSQSSASKKLTLASPRTWLDVADMGAKGQEGRTRRRGASLAAASGKARRGLGLVVAWPAAFHMRG
jgi:hypothetical protein